MATPRCGAYAYRDVASSNGGHVSSLALGLRSNDFAGTGQRQCLLLHHVLRLERRGFGLSEKPLHVRRVERPAEPGHLDHPLRDGCNPLYGLHGAGQNELVLPEDDPAVAESGEDLEVTVVDAREQQLVGAVRRQAVLDYRSLHGSLARPFGLTFHPAALSHP
jgi:hypothetical protein